MACHLKETAGLIDDLERFSDQGVDVKGVSCLGRCDRAPAVRVIRHGVPTLESPTDAQTASELHSGDRERCYLSRSAQDIKQIAIQYLSGKNPKSDRDSDGPSGTSDWMIDPYRGGQSDYGAVKKAVAARRASLGQAAELLQNQFKWTRENADRFRLAGEKQPLADLSADKKVAQAVREWLTAQGWADSAGLGGWSDAILAELDDAHADLRGMGGAGIPATQKWRDVRDAVRTARRRRTDDRAYIIVNGDESEPGTFKDRELLLRCPHLIVEAVVLAGLVTEASAGFIYIRHEYSEQIQACEQEIQRAETIGICGPQASVLGRPFPISVFVSPGGYICGEQSALIEAMSDRRGEPRNLPPKLETNGFNDKPTLVSNVETFAWAPYIYLNGGEAYAKLGVNGCRGRRFFSVSGDVNRPGVYEVPMGMPLRELICNEQYCQGIIDGRKLKALAPSGPSGGFLPAKLTAKTGLPRNYTTNKTWIELAKRRGFDPSAAELDILDLELELNVFRALSPTQALGAGIVVYAEGRDMAEQAVNALEFFRNESCGKCVPCRKGSEKLASLGENLIEGRIDSDNWRQTLAPLVEEMAEAMGLASICGLGRAAPLPLRTAMDYFSEDITAYLHHHARPAAAESSPVIKGSA
jgi:NADH:ubiquinone oxidoreductase subunit F (NADH-binding)